MIVAGEVSGDIHAANLVKAIKQHHPNIRFSGLGGRHLAEEGVELYADLTKLAVIGFIEVVRHFPAIRAMFNLILQKAALEQPDLVILVDYPGFNLRLAKKLKQQNIKVIYYVSPQVWAWKEKRIALIKRTVDRMIVFFDFEKTLYAQYGMHADFVGHPLIDHVTVTTSRFDMLRQLGLNPDAPTIGLLPGSRTKEIETLLPIMARSAEIIHQKIPSAQFILTKAKNLSQDLITQHLTVQHLPITIVDKEFHNCVNACDVCIVASGTATLETALLEKPMVIIYKTAWLTHLLCRFLIKIQWIGLPNIIARREIVPECLQNDAESHIIADKLLALYQNPFQMESTINALKDMRAKLGGPGASHRAAQIIIDELDKKPC